jgi:hypothetical protein
MSPSENRYPDPAVEIIDPAFEPYRLFHAAVERLATGFRWGRSGSETAASCFGATSPTTGS